MPFEPTDTETAVPADIPQNARAHRRDIILLVLFRASRSVAAGMIALTFPYIVLKNYGHSALTLGLIYTAASIATAVLGLAVGFLADHWGRKKSLELVAITLPISSALVYWGHGIWSLYAAAVIGGYSATGSLMGGGVGGAAQPIQSAIIASITSSRERTFYFSLFTFLSGVLAAGGTLMARIFTARESFLAATGIAAAGLIFLVPMRVPEFASRSRGMKNLKIIGQFSLTGLLNGFSQGLIAPFLIPFFVIVYKLPREQMATWGFVAGVLGSFAILAAPKMDRAFGFVRSIAVTRGIGAALLVVMPLVRFLPLSLAIYVLTPALRVAALPAQQRALTDMVTPGETGRALGLNQVTRLAAASGAVPLTGFLFAESDIGLPFYLYGAVIAANIALYFKFFGKHAGNAPGGEDS